MNKNFLTLNQLPDGKFGKVKALLLDGPIHRRLLDLGLIPGTLVKALKKSPSGDPTAYEIRKTTIALRLEETSKILIEPIKLQL